MNTARVASIHRQLARLHAELAEEYEHSHATADDWIDQYHSPLGKRKHLDLVREGVLSGRKPDRVHVFVRRSAIDAYIEQHPAKPSVAPAPSPSDEGKRVKSVGQLRAELGLVRVRKQA